jgi:hypothetical protein
MRGPITMDMKDTQQTSLRLPREDFNLARMVAEAMGISFNELVHNAILEYISAQGRRDLIQKHMQEAAERYRIALDKLADL